jgi:CBS domain containing-hemolysin-like protein
MISLLSLGLAFVFLSGLVAMVDAAILSVTNAEIGELVIQKRWGAVALQGLKQRITRAVIVVVIVTNTINVLGPILVGQKAISIYGNTAIGIVTALLTFGTIVFSEIIPKSLGSHYAPQISRVAAPAIALLIVLLYPIVLLLDWIAGLFRTGSRKIGTEHQIQSLVSLGRDAGLIEKDEGQLIQRAFILNDRTARDVMTPLERVAWLPDTATIREAAERVVHEEFSRYPVFGESPDQVQGFVLSRDILQGISEGRDQQSVQTLLRKPLMVSARRRSDDLLVIFRNSRIHLGIVRENRKTLGVVTLEDVLEELVGEIEDEKDAEAAREEAPDASSGSEP